MQTAVAFRRTLRDGLDRLSDSLLGTRPRCRWIFLQQHFGQILYLSTLRGKLVSQGLLDLCDKLWARPEIHRRLESLIADRAKSLAHADVGIAALFLVGFLAFGKKFKNSPYPANDGDYSAARRE